MAWIQPVHCMQISHSVFLQLYAILSHLQICVTATRYHQDPSDSHHPTTTHHYRPNSLTTTSNPFSSSITASFQEFYTGIKTTQCGKAPSLQRMVVRNLDIRMQKIKVNLPLTPGTRWTDDLALRPKTTEPLEKRTGQTPDGTRRGDGLLATAPKAQTIQAETDK